MTELYVLWAIFYFRYEHHVNASGGRISPVNMNYTDPDFLYPATVPLDSETHGGEDVGVYASGPWAHLFVGM